MELRSGWNDDETLPLAVLDAAYDDEEEEDWEEDLDDDDWEDEEDEDEDEGWDDDDDDEDWEEWEEDEEGYEMGRRRPPRPRWD